MAYKVAIVIVSYLLGLCSGGFKYSEAHKVPAIYVFGDSLVDVGNNNHLMYSFNKANFPHHGIDLPSKKATGRFCNGKNAADFLAEKLGVASPAPYLLLENRHKKYMNARFQNGVNFASAGARIFNETDKLIRQSISLSKQVEYYTQVHEWLMQQIGHSAAHKHLHESLFTIVIGSNDIYAYSRSPNLRSEITPNQHAHLATQNFKQQLKLLYKNHARKFAIVGVGAIGCTPKERIKNENQECSKIANDWSLMYNRALRSTLNKFKNEYKDIHFSYLDRYSLTQSFIKKPAAYGFVEVKAACCGLGKLNAEVPCLPITKYCANRNKYIFWDGGHPTEAVHRILVDYMYNGKSKYTFPMNVKKLAHI